VRLGIGKSGCKQDFGPIFLSSTKRGVPHISLVFREMWDTTALHVLLSKVGKKVKVRGVPHISRKKSEIWGTPRFVEGRKTGLATRNSVAELNLDKSD
jgi:hypothetical protein